MIAQQCKVRDFHGDTISFKHCTNKIKEWSDFNFSLPFVHCRETIGVSSFIDSAKDIDCSKVSCVVCFVWMKVLKKMKFKVTLNLKITITGIAIVAFISINVNEPPDCGELLV